MKKIIATLIIGGSMLFVGVIDCGVREKPHLKDPWYTRHIKTYPDLLDVFLSIMYARSGQLIPIEKYDQLVNAFLDEAENMGLNAITYCKEHPKNAIAHLFMIAVIDYAVNDFNYWIGFSKIAPSKILLRDRLELMHKKLQKETFDIDSELEKLTQLIHKANKNYYQALPWYMKSYISIVAPFS